MHWGRVELKLSYQTSMEDNCSRLTTHNRVRDEIFFVRLKPSVYYTLRGGRGEVDRIRLTLPILRHHENQRRPIEDVFRHSTKMAKGGNGVS